MTDSANFNNQTVVSGPVVDPNGPKFKTEDGVNTRKTQDNSFTTGLNIQLTVDNVTNIGVVQAERQLREQIDDNAKAISSARRDKAGFEKAMQDALTAAASATYTNHNATLTNAFNTSQWSFDSSNTFQLVEGRSGAVDVLRVDATVTATYRGPATSLTGEEKTLTATFKETVPPTYYEARTNLHTVTVALTTLEEESMRLRRELSNLPSLQRSAQAAITERILRDQGQVAMIEDMKRTTSMKALPGT